MASSSPSPVSQTPSEEEQHSVTKVTTGDTLNGAHPLASTSGQDIKESQAFVSQERNVNGLAYSEERASSELERGRTVDEEREENRQTTQLPPQSAAVAPPHAPPTATPHPPSLVQSGSSTVDASLSEEGKTAVRTAPPALVGYEAMTKESRGEERGEMETNGRERDTGERPREAGEGEEGPKRVVSEGEVRHTREESPDLVIDTHSQHVGEEAPAIINNPETESSEKHKHVGVNLVTRNSQVLPESTEASALNRENLIGQPDSPHSSSGNEDVDLDMEIIEEGEEEGGGETPPTALPPKGVLMKADNTTTISQAGHIQSPHPHIGISPSHTAAMESLKKGESVRKPNVIVATPSSSGAGGHNPNREGGGGGGGGESGKDRHSVVSDSFRVRQVAKVKQFFTTLQQFGNKNGSEVAEQVQELITAVVNETASVEEFHQEVQSALNFPLKDFIIPFLKENLKHLRAELKETSHSLSELLGDDGSIPETVGLTPQLVDDELPVLPSASQSGGSTVRTVSNSVITQGGSGGGGGGGGASGSGGSSTTGNVSSVSKSSSVSRSAHTNVASSSRPAHQSIVAPPSRVHPQQHGTGTGAVVIPHSHSHPHSPVVIDSDSGSDYVPVVPSVSSMQRKRMRRASFENRSSGIEKDMQMDRAHAGHLPKRPRPDHTSLPSYITDNTITTQSPLSHIHPTPHYPQPPPIHSTAPGLGEGGAYFTGLPMEVGGNVRKKTLTEDWGHVQMMLGSIQGMVERARQAMDVLKNRVNATQTELEKREHERDTQLKQRVAEAVEKVKRQAAEEKQRLVVEANTKLRDSVSAARSEIESRVAQMQALAVQEALKEANAQSSSKENCWNCGRRATETCSGCNKARYCGTFCQHKDWANHMHHCASGLAGQANTVEETYERRDNIRHHQPIALATNEVALMGRGGAPIRQTVAIPLNMVSGSEMSIPGVPTRIPHSHTDIAVTVVKTEKV